MSTNKIKMTTKYGSSFLTEEEIEIKIQGLQNVYKFIHISDLHIIGTCDDDSEEAKMLAENRNEFWRNQAGYICNENSNNERKLYPAEVNEIVAERIRYHKPDKVFFTGDTVDYPSLKNLELAKDYLMSLNTDCIMAPGNHDEVSNDASEDLKNLLNEITDGCSDFKITSCEEFNIITINDGNVKITENQYSMTKEALKSDKKAIILLHVPLYHPEQKNSVWSYWGYNWMIGEEQQSKINRDFLHLLESNRNKIAAIFAGHVHMALGENSQNPNLLPQYIAAPCFCGYLRVINIHG